MNLFTCSNVVYVLQHWLTKIIFYFLFLLSFSFKLNSLFGSFYKMEQDLRYKAAYNPVNEDPPTDADLRADSDLSSYMSRNIAIESDKEMERRNEVLEAINRIFVKWVRDVGKKKMNILEEDSQDDVGGLLFISGSHRLNVRDPNADIDTICVAPAYCTRDDFFDSLQKVLEDHPDVEELNPVSGAFVPLIELEFRGVAIDLLFARLAENVVTSNLDILDDNILANVDRPTEMSLNGPRVTDMISKLVPNYDNFLIVLRCVRKWAKARALYGNKFGYLGGVNYNIMVAFIGQLYPRSSPSALLARFFRVYSNWDWPTPIMLNRIRPEKPGENRVVWDPKMNPDDLMPLITPAYPAMNSSHNVNRHSLSVMKSEFERAHNIMQSINKNIHARPTTGESVNNEEIDENWGKLFEPSDFFVRYHHYLRCNIVGGTDAGAAAQWQAFVESRMRYLVTAMDSLPIQEPIHLFPVKSKNASSNNSICYFVGFNADKTRLRGDQGDIYLDKAISIFSRRLQKYTGPRGPNADTNPAEATNGNDSEITDVHFTYEYYKWRHLPKECFDSIGGQKVAKELRLKYFPKKEKKEDTEGVEKMEDERDVNTETGEGKEGIVKSETDSNEAEDDVDGKSSKKRKLDDVNIDNEGAAAAAAIEMAETNEVTVAIEKARRKAEADARPLPTFFAEDTPVFVAKKLEMQQNSKVQIEEVKWSLLQTTS